MRGKHNASAPREMSFSAALLHLGCCKDWKKKISFPEQWEYNFEKLLWQAKKDTEHFMVFTDMKTKEKTKVYLIINDRDLLYAK